MGLINKGPKLLKQPFLGCHIAEKALDKNGAAYKVIQEVIMACTSSASEIINGFTTEFGSAGASSAVVDIVSSDGADDSRLVGGSAAATHVKYFGINTVYDYVVEEVALTGASAATTTTTWARLIDKWVSQCGSGGSANVGSLTTYNTGSTSYVFSTIAAGKNATSSMRMWIPPNWHLHTHNMTACVADESVAIAGGSRFYPVYDDFQGVTNVSARKASVYIYAPFEGEHYWDLEVEPKVEPAKVTWYQQCNSSSQLTNISYRTKYILVPKKASLSSTQTTKIYEV